MALLFVLTTLRPRHKTCLKKLCYGKYKTVIYIYIYDIVLVVHCTFRSYTFLRLQHRSFLLLSSYGWLYSRRVCCACVDGKLLGKELSSVFHFQIYLFFACLPKEGWVFSFPSFSPNMTRISTQIRAHVTKVARLKVVDYKPNRIQKHTPSESKPLFGWKHAEIQLWKPTSDSHYDAWNISWICGARKSSEKLAGGTKEERKTFIWIKIDFFRKRR